MDVISPANEKILLRVETHAFDPVVNPFEFVISLWLFIDHGPVAVRDAIAKSDTN